MLLNLGSVNLFLNLGKAFADFAFFIIMKLVTSNQQFQV